MYADILEPARLLSLVNQKTSEVDIVKQVDAVDKTLKKYEIMKRRAEESNKGRRWSSTQRRQAIEYSRLDAGCDLGQAVGTNASNLQSFRELQRRRPTTPDQHETFTGAVRYVSAVGNRIL